MNELNQQLIKQWTDAEGMQYLNLWTSTIHSKDLYTQRMYLTALAFNSNPSDTEIKEHSDDSNVPGYFIVGITTPLGQYTYHYKLEHWDLFKVPELERAPEWDGHTSKDIFRIMSIPTSSDSWYSVYHVSEESVLLYFLNNGIEEVLLPRPSLQNISKTFDEYDEFITTVNINTTDCLLTKRPMNSLTSKDKRNLIKEFSPSPGFVLKLSRKQF